jgi:hypothetical protein
MKFHLLKYIHNDSDQRNGLALAGVLLTCLLVGCGSSKQDTFIRFQVDGQSYEVKDSTLTVTQMPFDLRFFDLTYPHKRLIPGAMIQWRMKIKIKSVDDLVGLNMDLKAEDPNQIEPVMAFRMTEDLRAESMRDSNAHLKIDQIKNGFIEGSFTGKDLFYTSKTKGMIGKVDVTAQFRAKLVQKGK